MRIAIVDIKPNTAKYDRYLTDALFECGNDITLFTADPSVTRYRCHVIKLRRFFKRPVIKANNILKGLNWLLNYLYIIRIVRKEKYEIVHFEWFVFLQHSSVEVFFLKLLSKRSKIVFTAHNVFPHSIDVDHNTKAAIIYKKRFKKIDTYLSHYIVHTHASAIELSQEYNIPFNKISVCIHGLFLPEIQTPICPNNNNNRFKICMFGVQSPYKGTDVLVEAFSQLPQEVKNKVAITIAGVSTDYRGTFWPSRASSLGINWVDKLLDEKELHELLNETDLIVFPYRAISQSGALLLALSYGKPLLVSDLPSFRETLLGCPDDVFFKVENTKELSMRIRDFVEGSISITPILNAINQIRDRMSWTEAARQTISAYNHVFN